MARADKAKRNEGYRNCMYGTGTSLQNLFSGTNYVLNMIRREDIVKECEITALYISDFGIFVKLLNLILLFVDILF